MAITREYGEIVFICDKCGEPLNTECEDFNNALAVLRDEEWRSRKTERETTWRHYCPDCAKY